MSGLFEAHQTFASTSPKANQMKTTPIHELSTEQLSSVCGGAPGDGSTHTTTAPTPQITRPPYPQDLLNRLPIDDLPVPVTPEEEARLHQPQGYPK
jgi:hypothetical protein